MDYQYTPLEHSREFRLVQLGVKSHETKEASLTFELSHHSIDNVPTYNTLSYTWATPVKNFRGYQATDPRDMVFALLRIQYDTQGSILVPDYSRNVEKTYTLVTHLIITKYGLKILCESGLQNRALDYLPSWVIDW